MKKRIAIVLTIVTAVTLLTAFTDVPKTHWAYTELSNAEKLGLVNGVGNDLYEPARSISKQEIATLLHRALGLFGNAEDIDADYSSECAAKLANAEVSGWAAKSVAYGLQNGLWTETELIEGGAAASVPGRDLIAQWTYRVLTGRKDFGLRILPYEDSAAIEPMYYEAVDALWKYGIMRGSDAGFLPGRPFTRVEAGVIGARIVEKLKADTKAYEAEPYVYESGVLESFDSNFRRFNIDGKLFNIAADAKIVLDGRLASFDELSSLKGKKVLVSQYLGGANTMSLIIQTQPKLLSGEVEQIKSFKTGAFKADPHELITIKLDGVSLDYVRNNDTEALSGLQIGNTVQFIADGIYLLEIK